MQDKSDFVWVEKYRPEKVEDCILPKKIKTVFLSFVKDGSLPNLLLSGTAGTGKTTVAKAVCKELGYDVLFINGSSERNLDTVRNTIGDFASTVSLSGNKKCILIDEADSMTDLAQKALRATMETFPFVSFIFTCNYRNKIIDPIQSRTAVIEFSVSPEEKTALMGDFLKRILSILETENVSADKKCVAEVVKRYFPDNRRILNELQKYAATGSIDEGILSIKKTSQVELLPSFLKDRDLASCRQWAANNKDVDISVVFRQIYDVMYTSVQPESVPSVIMIIADYMYKAMFVPDQEINMVAMFAEIIDTNSGVVFK